MLKQIGSMVYADDLSLAIDSEYCKRSKNKPRVPCSLHILACGRKPLSAPSWK